MILKIAPVAGSGIQAAFMKMLREDVTGAAEMDGPPPALVALTRG